MCRSTSASTPPLRPHDGKPFEEKFARLYEQLDEQFRESAKLEAEIRRNLERLGAALKDGEERAGARE